MPAYFFIVNAADNYVQGQGWPGVGIGFYTLYSGVWGFAVSKYLSKIFNPYSSLAASF
tara:strand:+ start:188 stop:361 length:174 start_codon:yes stop_codon:yes gene_type:complete